MAEKAHVLSSNEMSGLQQELEETQSQVRAVENKEFGAGGPGEQVDLGKLKARERSLKREIELGTAPSVRAKAKDGLAVEARELEDKIRLGMPTIDEMKSPVKHPGAVI